MKDFWSFLLQTLTASGAAVLLLAAKAMFRDKLSPRWQFASWGLLGLALLIPAGSFGRYALLNWPAFVETVKSVLTGEYGTLTRVSAPLPLPFFHREGAGLSGNTVFDGIYIVYVAGVAFFLMRYAVLYLRLRLALKRVEKENARRALRSFMRDGGQWGGSGAQAFVDAAAEKYCLASCRVLEAEGIETAFICGVFRPVLVFPVNMRMDEKIVLHELLHLKHRDVLWGLVICLFRCLHWCNPLLWMCADLAGNDLEALCDQRALERLSGEERRDYGCILLDMAGGKYAKMPGTSSVANGGKNIRRRITAIVRFKKYPAGMGVVSVCILLLFSVPFLAGTKPAAVFGKGSVLPDSRAADMARARTIRCTTYAGAFDTYAKAVLTGNIPYLAMCSPLGEQNLLARVYREGGRVGSLEKMSLPAAADVQSGYRIYNLARRKEDVWEGLLVFGLLGYCDGTDSEETGERWYAAQNVCAKKENDRWVVIPEGEFRAVRADSWALMFPDIDRFPAWCYEAKGEDFTLRMRWQTAASVESRSQDVLGLWSSAFEATPQPDSFFSYSYSHGLTADYTGKPEDKGHYRQIGFNGRIVWNREEDPASENRNYFGSHASGSGGSGNTAFDPSLKGSGTGSLGGKFSGGSTDGTFWGSISLGEIWEDTVRLDEGGSTTTRAGIPDCFIVKVRFDGRSEEELTLEPVEGGGTCE